MDKGGSFGDAEVVCQDRYGFSYEAAMDALSTLISRRKRGDGPKRDDKLGRMSMYMKILGLEEGVADLKIIHVAGTKGKGSTCAFCESILRECGFRTGLFTSPHLVDVRERYRIRGLDIAEDKFLVYFWDCWNQLKEHVTEDLSMPPLFSFLTLLAFQIFVAEKVDVAIIEVGLGGRLDSTNVIKEPVVCGITSLGMDHMEVLGDTLGEIASEKAGIFKPQVPAFTVPQIPEAMDALKKKASDINIPLKVALPLDPNVLSMIKLGLAGDHQFINAGLAVALCKAWLSRTGHMDKFPANEGYLPEAFLSGLSSASLSGRAQIVKDTWVKTNKSVEMKESSCGDLIFYLDGAHSPESMEVCARWFSSAVKEQRSVSGLNAEIQQNGTTKLGHAISNGSNKISKQVDTVGEAYEVVKAFNLWKAFGPDEFNGKFCKSRYHMLINEILLFNCMDVRDPQVLLPKLFNTCASSGIHFSKALFVPSLSSYHKVTSGAFPVVSDKTKDLSWQYTLQRTWDKIIGGKDANIEESYQMKNIEILPSQGIDHEEISVKSTASSKQFEYSAVMTSLPATLKWLRDCISDNPSLRLQVLVTGSLHLVGDVLKLLRK